MICWELELVPISFDNILENRKIKSHNLAPSILRFPIRVAGIYHFPSDLPIVLNPVHLPVSLALSAEYLCRHLLPLLMPRRRSSLSLHTDYANSLQD